MSALTIAAAGMNAAAARFDRNATNITRATAGTSGASDIDVGAEMVDMMINQNSFEVLARVARSADEMNKAGIDILV